jgi:hypothetical protein
LNQEVREGSKKRKLEEVAPDQEVVEPVEAPYDLILKPSHVLLNFD